jgi:DNA-binding XRE family transcriptional regulator
MNKIKELIVNSGHTRYAISKRTGVKSQSMDSWFKETAKPNITILKVLKYISKDDNELIKNINSLLDE